MICEMCGATGVLSEYEGHYYCEKCLAELVTEEEYAVYVRTCNGVSVWTEYKELMHRCSRLENGSRIILTTEMIELLAEVEHNQWSHWTNYYLDHMNLRNMNRWARQTTQAYPDLSEHDKEKDREWARKVFRVLHLSDVEIINPEMLKSKNGFDTTCPKEGADSIIIEDPFNMKIDDVVEFRECSFCGLQFAMVKGGGKIMAGYKKTVKVQ